MILISALSKPMKEPKRETLSTKKQNSTVQKRNARSGNSMCSGPMTLMILFNPPIFAVVHLSGAIKWKVDRYKEAYLPCS